MKTAEWRDLGERLKRKRTEKKFTKKDMADFLGVSAYTYGRIEQGKRELTVGQLTTLCFVFRVSPDYLLMGNPGFWEYSDLIRNLQEMAPKHREVTLDVAEHFYQRSVSPSGTEKKRPYLRK